MEISIFHKKHWFFSYRKIYVPFLLMFSHALNICMSTHMSILPTFLCLSVWMCVIPQLAEMNVTDCEIWSKPKAHQASTECGRLVHASLRWSCSRQEWGKDGQWQLRRVCSQIWIYIKRHKEAHSFFFVNVCVCLPGKECGKLEDSSSVNPVVRGF